LWLLNSEQPTIRRRQVARQDAAKAIKAPYSRNSRRDGLPDIESPLYELTAHTIEQNSLVIK
jgi:hypothetical protein